MRKLFAGLMSLALLSACSQEGDEYVGKWVHSEYKDHTMEIVRNGDNYLIRTSEPGFRVPRTASYPATSKEGILQISTGFGAVSLAVDESTGRLVRGRAEYVKKD